MSDREPLISHALDLLVPAVACDPNGWERVLVDAGIKATRPRRRPAARRDRRRLLILAAALVVLVVGGAAVAGTRDWGPFAGIAAANHSQTAQDVLDPAVVTQLHQIQRRSPFGRRFLFGTSRLVVPLSNSGRIYVIGTTANDLCVLVVKNGKRLGSIGCGNPLTQTEPTTITTEDRVVNGPNATTPLSYGIAQNGISAVSFIAEGKETTVPVKKNVWAYEGRNQALKSLTVHYTDGTTRTLSH